MMAKAQILEFGTCWLLSLEFICDTIKDDRHTGLSIFFKSSSTSQFTGSTFYSNKKKIHEYLIHHSLKSGGTNVHFRQVKVPGTAPY